jgi:y4mF family transcriptional regulator
MSSPRNPAELGRAIRERRRALGLDQATLARRVGVSRQWVVEVEGGKERAEVGLVLRTLAALGLEVSLAPRASRRKTREPFVPGMVDIDAIVERARGRK